MPGTEPQSTRKRGTRKATPRRPRACKGRRASKAAVAGSASAGFTLIELMVVLVILGLLAGLVGPQLFGRIDTSKVKTAETQPKLALFPVAQCRSAHILRTEVPHIGVAPR